MSGAATDDLLYLLYFWIATFLSTLLAEFTRTSPLLFYLILGCVLGNLKWVHHTEFLTSFAEFSIAVVFFALGFEENVRHFLEGIRKAWGIAFIGAAVPFGCGFGCTMLFWPDIDIKAALMGGLAVTATAVSLTMIALKAEGLATSKPAIGIMTSAVLDDIASLACVAIMVPIASGEASPTLEGISWILGKAALFFLSIIVAHTVVFPHAVQSGLVSYIPIVRTYGARNLLSMNQGEQATLISLTFGLFFGMVALWFGFHPAIGTYMSGLIMEEHYFDIEDDDGEIGNTYQHTLHFIEGAAFGWLGPVFFLNLGASIIIEADVLGKVIGYSLIFYVVMCVGQFTSATFAARYVPGGFTWGESAMIGFGMLGRAELFFVVLNICYNEYDIMHKEMFYTFTFTAMLLNITVPICIVLYKPFYLRSKGKRNSVENAAVAWEKQVSPEDLGVETETVEPLSPSIVNTPFGDYVKRRAKNKEAMAARRVFEAQVTSSLASIPSSGSTSPNAETVLASFSFSSYADDSMKDGSSTKDFSLMDPPHIRNRKVAADANAESDLALKVERSEADHELVTDASADTTVGCPSDCSMLESTAGMVVGPSVTPSTVTAHTAHKRAAEAQQNAADGLPGSCS